MATRLLARAYMGVIYTAQEIAWGFEKRDAREDQLRDYLRKLGISTIYLNLYLDREGISREAGRFPELFQTHDSLIDRVASDCLNLSHFPHDRVFTSDEKKSLLQ
jgi:hypothetical protein